MSFEEWKDGLVAINPGTIGHRCDCCDWADDDGRAVCHERTYWPTFRWMAHDNPSPSTRRVIDNLNVVRAAFGPETFSSYWTEPCYKDEGLAQRHAQQFGGEVVKHFYCDDDDPAWFIRFSDFDRMAAFMWEWREGRLGTVGFETVTEAQPI